MHRIINVEYSENCCHLSSDPRNLKVEVIVLLRILQGTHSIIACFTNKRDLNLADLQAPALGNTTNPDFPYSPHIQQHPRPDPA